MNYCKGLSLTELMVSIAVISTLFAVGLPTFTEWIQNQQIKSAAQSITSGVQAAKIYAVTNNEFVRFTLCNPPDASWEILQSSAPAAAPAVSASCPNSTESPGEFRVKEATGQDNVRYVQIVTTPASSVSITFNGLGRISPNADGSATITQFDLNNPNGDRPLRIPVGVTGSTRTCDPSPLLAANDLRRC